MSLTHRIRRNAAQTKLAPTGSRLASSLLQTQQLISSLPALNHPIPPKPGMRRALHPSYRNGPTNVLFESLRTFFIIRRARPCRWHGNE
jgi:hypothetical protein